MDFAVRCLCTIRCASTCCSLAKKPRRNLLPLWLILRKGRKLFSVDLFTERLFNETNRLATKVIGSADAIG